MSFDRLVSVVTW